MLVSQQTALDSGGPAMSPFGITRVFGPVGVRPRQLRADRILDEAREAADPVRLMRIFGIAANTTLRYLNAAHSERFSRDPIQP